MAGSGGRRNISVLIGVRGVWPDQNATAPVPFDPNQIYPIACFTRQHAAGGGASVELAHKQAQAAYLGIQ